MKVCRNMIVLVGVCLGVLWAGPVAAQFAIEFSVDIGSDSELSDPQILYSGNEVFDPGDVYVWQSTQPMSPGGADGFKDDATLFGVDPYPDPPDTLQQQWPFPPYYPTAVPVGEGGAEDYVSYFDLDGHDQLDLSLSELFGSEQRESGELIPIGWFGILTNCFHVPYNMMISFDDDMKDGWPAGDVPVTVSSPAGLVYGTTANQDEIVGLGLIPAGVTSPQWQVVSNYTVADEILTHINMTPSPDLGEMFDDDVDSLDAVPDGESACSHWYFSADHEANNGLIPGNIYEQVAVGGVVPVIDVQADLGLPAGTDIDAFEFVQLWSPGLAGPALGLYLGLVFSVDDNDSLTAVDESGGLNPAVIYASFLNGQNFPLVSDPMPDDIDAITCWSESIEHEPLYPGWVAIQSPPATTNFVGDPTEWLYGRVWVDGVTSNPGPDPSVLAQVGYGPDGSDPDGNASWNWVNAAWNAQVGTNDEYWARLTVHTPGVYDYAYRFSVNGGIDWLYADMVDEPTPPGGSDNGYDPAHAGDLTVEPFGTAAKWSQPPDLSPNGMDVHASYEPGMLVLADDFECTTNGYITGITVWGSWVGDNTPDPDPSNVGITLSIHADIPAEQSPYDYSIPGEVLWYTNISPPDFTVYVDAEGLEEGWYNPYNQSYDPQGDTICYRYVFQFDQADAFFQRGTTNSPVVYWLDVQAKLVEPAPYIFGWKTSTQHWNDDAVWAAEAEEPYEGSWNELRYPPGHPQFPESIDLAFEIWTTEGEEPEPEPEDPEKCPKWQQPPDCEYGMDLPSYTVWEDGVIYTNVFIVADDWLCDGRPVNAIRWWGSYTGWDGDPLQPPQDSLSGRPVRFRLTWYTDMPADQSGTGHSMPLERIKQIEVDLLPYGVAPPAPGYVSERWYCTVESKQDPSSGEPAREHEYEYYLELEDPWLEKDGRVYWLSIEAVCSMSEAGPPPYPVEWGWKTTPPWYNWNDDAVLGEDDPTGGPMPTWRDLTWPDYPWSYLWSRAIGGYDPFLDGGEDLYSVNMAFELLTDICPARCKKWAQPPDMVNGENWECWGIPGGYPGIVRADDFISDGRPITDIHWWGSYIGWETNTWYTESAPPPLPPLRPDAFLLSWHTNDSVSGGPAVPPLEEIVVPMKYCHEQFYGSVTQWWKYAEGENPPVYDHEFQYYVDLLDTNANPDAQAWLEQTNGWYWLNIQALYTDQEPSEFYWGWKNTPVETPYEAPCVESFDGGANWLQALTGPNYGPWPNSYFDLAFELTTTNIPTVPPTDVMITNLAMHIAPDDTALVTSAGYCGCGKQKLQVSTNLLDGEAGWKDWPPPDGVRLSPMPVNTWPVGSLSSQMFFRVKQYD